MSDKHNVKDNIIIALAVALAVATICCCVLGVILGIGDVDVKGSSVAEAYYSPSSNDIEFAYYYLDLDVEYEFTYGDNYTFEYTLNDVVSDMVGVGYDDAPAYTDYVVPVVWTVSIALDDYVQTDPVLTWFEFSIGTYRLGSSAVTYSYYRADSSNNFYIDFDTYGSDCYFDIEFRDSSTGDAWCLYYIEEVELSYLRDERGFNWGYASGYEHGLDDGLDSGYENGYDVGYDEGYDRGNDVGYSDGYIAGYGSGESYGYNQGFYEGVSSASDYSFFSLITAVFDAPLRAIVGTWTDTNGDGVLDSLVGGMLNFYLPVLDLNLAPLLTALFTLAVIFIGIRFILAKI